MRYHANLNSANGLTCFFLSRRRLFILYSILNWADVSCGLAFNSILLLSSSVPCHFDQSCSFFFGSSWFPIKYKAFSVVHVGTSDATNKRTAQRIHWKCIDYLWFIQSINCKVCVQTIRFNHLFGDSLTYHARKQEKHNAHIHNAYQLNAAEQLSRTHPNVVKWSKAVAKSFDMNHWKSHNPTIATIAYSFLSDLF